MEKVEYSDIVFLEKMKDIKATIRNSGFRIDHEKAYHVDQQMREIIDQLYDENNEDNSLVALYKKLDRKIERRVSDTMVFYYFALYQDNLELLEKLLREGVELYDENNHSCLELLDRDFTKYFSFQQFLFLVNNCREELLTFYNHVFAQVPISRETDNRKNLVKELNDLSMELFSSDPVLADSLRERYEKRLAEISKELKAMSVPKYSEEERDTLCRQFVEIMTKDPFICKTGKKGQYRDEYYHDLLIPEVIQIFGVDDILRLNDVQKRLISESTSDGMLVRLKKLFDKYPHYSCKMKLNPMLLQTFSDEELASLSEEDIPLYERASLEEISMSYKHALQENPILRKYPEIIRKDIFDVLTEDSIVHLSDNALHRIHNLIVHSKVYDQKEKYHIQRRSMRIAKADRVLQKVKNRFNKNKSVY